MLIKIGPEIFNLLYKNPNKLLTLLQSHDVMGTIKEGRNTMKGRGERQYIHDFFVGMSLDLVDTLYNKRIQL